MNKYKLKDNLPKHLYIMYNYDYGIKSNVFYLLIEEDNHLMDKNNFALNPKDFISEYDDNINNIENQL